jgi:predicted amidohydrolase
VADALPVLETTTAGITSIWARKTAKEYNCTVSVGYPETTDPSHNWPKSPEYYNSVVVVDADGQTITNFRKSLLSPTDKNWAQEGRDGFFDRKIEELGHVAMGIGKCSTKSFERDYSNYKYQTNVLYYRHGLGVYS